MWRMVFGRCDYRQKHSQYLQHSTSPNPRSSAPRVSSQERKDHRVFGRTIVLRIYYYSAGCYSGLYPYLLMSQRLVDLVRSSILECWRTFGRADSWAGSSVVEHGAHNPRSLVRIQLPAHDLGLSLHYLLTPAARRGFPLFSGTKVVKLYLEVVIIGK